MARDDRRGKRKTREERSKRRVPEMGYYLVVTDTEATERLYFHGLHESLPAEVRKKLVIKVVETKTQKLVEKCKLNPNLKLCHKTSFQKVILSKKTLEGGFILKKMRLTMLASMPASLKRVPQVQLKLGKTFGWNKTRIQGSSISMKPISLLQKAHII